MIVELNHINKEWISSYEAILNEQISIISKEELKKNIKFQQNVTVLIGKVDDFTDINFLKLFSRLQIIYVLSDGVEGLPYKYLLKHNIILGHATGLQEDTISDYVMGAMLIFSKRFIDCMNQKQWINNLIGSVLRGKSLLIFGYGRIGVEIAKKANVFGMRVYGVCTNINLARHLEYLDGCFDLNTVGDTNYQSNFIVSCLPLTPKTEKFFSKNILEKMGADTVFINVSRGGVVDEGDLLTILKEKRIKGAVLDVLENEPLDSDSPFWNLSNVIITSHIAGRLDNYLTCCIGRFVEIYLQYKRTGVFEDCVDLEKGY